jgi:dihydrofolate reductase
MRLLLRIVQSYATAKLRECNVDVPALVCRTRLTNARGCFYIGSRLGGGASVGTVYSSASMSLDGFIAYRDHNPGALFDWYQAGDVELATAMEDLTFHVTEASCDYLRGQAEALGALVVGRRLFDVTDGWKGRHPYDVPVVVMTHEPPADWSYPGAKDFHFVTEGIAAAVRVAQTIAGDREVAVAAGAMPSVTKWKSFEADLLDEVRIDLAPVVLGSGRPYFTGGTTRLLGEPTTVIRTARVTHLIYPVRRD